MKKINSLLLYFLAAGIFTFTSCEDDSPVVTPPQNQNPEPEPEEEEPVEEAVQNDTIGFESLTFPEGFDAFYGQDLSGENMGAGAFGGTDYAYTYESGPGIFNLTFNENPDYISWNGVAYSRQTDSTLTGTEGQFVAMPAEGAEGSEVYAIMHNTDTISFTYEEGAVPQSIWITNNAYAYHSMKNGDQFAKKFGGTDGNDEDFFKLIITGLDSENNETGTVEVYLADFRFDDNSEDYILDTWEKADLTSLGTVSKLAFKLESSDTGEYGMNTPDYFAFDNLVTKPAETE